MESQSKLIDGIEIVGTLERASASLSTNLSKFLSRKLETFFMSWGCFLVNIKRVDLSDDVFELGEHEVLKACRPKIPDNFNVVDNLSSEGDLWIINSELQIPIPIFEGKHSVSNAETKHTPPHKGDKWYHCDFDNYHIRDLADKLYSQDNIIDVYLVIMTVPMKIVYIPRF